MTGHPKEEEEEEDGGRRRRRLIKNTEEEGRRLVGEPEKQATCVCCPDLVSLLFFLRPLLLLPSANCSPSSLRHPSDFHSPYLRPISSSSLSLSVVFCAYELNPPKHPVLGFFVVVVVKRCIL